MESFKFTNNDKIELARTVKNIVTEDVDNSSDTELIIVYNSDLTTYIINKSQLDYYKSKGFKVYMYYNHYCSDGKTTIKEIIKEINRIKL